MYKNFAKKFFFLFLCIIAMLPHMLMAQNNSKSKRIDYRGFVFEQGNKMPIPGATVNLPQYGISTITDSDGMFSFKQVPVGVTDISIRFVGMLVVEKKVNISEKSSSPQKFYMSEENFALDEVVVTAKNNRVGAATSSSISRTAIDHLQATSLTDIMELLPGQLASNPTLNSPGKASLRQVQTDALNSMGTSIVFNGAPVSNNANLQIGNTAKDGSLNTSFTSTAGSGTDMRQISVDNIESVDVIRGIPSVEYGDLTSGVIIINPKAGVYPIQVRLKINPTLTQTSIGKGFNLGKEYGKLSFDFDYAKSLADERRPSQGFQRFTGNLLYTKVFREKLNTTTGLGFYSDLDAQKLDPSDTRYQRERSSKNTGFKFNTNVAWNCNYKLLKVVRLNLSANYEVQKGYNQEIKGNFGYMVTSAMNDGTIASNRQDEIYDASGHQITNIGSNPAATNILPYEFLTKMTTYGKPLNLFAKVTSNFFADFWKIKNRIVAGAEWKTDVNFGRGKVFDPLMPPSSGIRMRPYTDIPALNQLSFYVEDNAERVILDRSLKVQLGARFDMIQPGKEEGGTVISPRINLSYELVPNILSIRGGFGITAKAPPLMYLYPDKAYYDFINFDNSGLTGLAEQQKLSIVTTKVYDTANKNLKIAKNRKSEIGFELKLGQMNFSVTGYNEKLKNGYSFGSDFDSYHLFDLIKYTGVNRTGTYPELTVDKTTKIVLGYNKPLNDKINENNGVEFDFDFGQIKAIRTSFILNGAWMQSKLYSTSNSFYEKSPDADGTYKDIGVYGSGDGSLYERFSTNLRIVHNIPRIGFVISLSMQTIWTDTHKYLGLENKYPIGYLSASNLSYTPIVAGSSISPDIQRQILLNREITDSYSPLCLFNLRLTKEIKKFGGFAFFVNNLFNSNPLEENKRNPGNYKSRNPEQFFGTEIWFKF